MEKKERVLAYYTSKELTNDELKEVSGGTSRMTTYSTQRLSGSYPGQLDAVIDQTLDW